MRASRANRNFSGENGSSLSFPKYGICEALSVPFRRPCESYRTPAHLDTSLLATSARLAVSPAIRTLHMVGVGRIRLP